MKILLVHNFYGSATPSGENQVIDAEKNLLLSRGNDLHVFSRHSDEIRAQGSWGMLKGAFATPWNQWMASAIRREVERFQPDIVHVHNTFPLISPAIFSAIGNRAVRVLTLHNYRLLCPAAIPMRAGHICTECIDSCSVLPALRSSCYRGSMVATAPLAMNVALHRFLGTWRNDVDAFVALSEFQRDLMASGGLPLEKIHVKPNFYPGLPSTVAWCDRKPYIVFAGRLGAEKGVLSLLKAWQMWGESAPELRLVGHGELREELERMSVGLPVKFLGQVSGEEAQRQIAGAKLQILPSEWFEGFPMVVREAFAFGTPAAVSNIGPLPSIVKHGVSGLVFEPGNPDSLLQTVRSAWLQEGLLEQLGKGARQGFLDNYTEDANYAQLMGIYESALERNGALR